MKRLKLLLRRTLLIAAALVMMVPPSTMALEPIQSQEPDMEFRNSNDILPFHYPEVSVCTPGGPGTTVSGTDNISKMWNYFVSKGLSGEQAAGILGNIQQESGFSPFRQETGKWPLGGYGIVQWTGPRRVAIVDVIKKELPDIHQKYYSNTYGGPVSADNGYIPNGVEVEDNDRMLALQLDYLYEESTTRPVRKGIGATEGASEWEAIKASSTIRQSSDIWLKSFERPADQSDSHAATRASLGQVIFDRLNGTSSGGGGAQAVAGTSGTSRCGGAVAGDLAATTLAYAWPEYRGNDVTKKPEYEEANKKARNDGQYTGHTCHGGGVDCGAFVSRLLIDSGFEPEYNSAGRGGRTGNPNEPGTQYGWLTENWQRLGSGSEIDSGSLQPGDVAINDGHTFIFVGDIPGFGAKIASASMCTRAPMADSAQQATDGSFVWFRKGAKV